MTLVTARPEKELVSQRKIRTVSRTVMNANGLDQWGSVAVGCAPRHKKWVIADLEIPPSSAKGSTFSKGKRANLFCSCCLIYSLDL